MAVGFSRRPVTPVRSHGRHPGGWRKLGFRRRRSTLVKQILASSKRAKRLIDLTGDDDNDGEGGDGDFTEVSWLRTTRTARHLVRLIPSSLIDRIRVAGQLHSPLHRPLW